MAFLGIPFLELTCPLKIDGWKMNFILRDGLFSGAVFRTLGIPIPKVPNQFGPRTAKATRSNGILDESCQNDAQGEAD